MAFVSPSGNVYLFVGSLPQMNDRHFCSEPRAPRMNEGSFVYAPITPPPPGKGFVVEGRCRMDKSLIRTLSIEAGSRSCLYT